MGKNKFIICGVSRAGKSLLCQRLQQKYNVSHLLGDALICSLADAFPSLGLSAASEDTNKEKELAAFFSYILWHYGYAGKGYVFDTVHLTPETLFQLQKKTGPVEALFLGYAEADAMQKCADIRSNDLTDNWWTAEMSDADLYCHVEEQIEKSRIMRTACARLGLPYCEMSGDFPAAISRAMTMIGEGGQP